MRKKDIEVIKDIIHIQEKEYIGLMSEPGSCNDYADGYVQACEDISDELADHFVDWED